MNNANYQRFIVESRLFMFILLYFLPLILSITRERTMPITYHHEAKNTTDALK